jgi:hypothetical protein
MTRKDLAMPTTLKRDRTTRPQHRPTRDAIAAVRLLGRRRPGRHRDPIAAQLTTDLERHHWSLSDLLDEGVTPGATR